MTDASYFGTDSTLPLAPAAFYDDWTDACHITAGLRFSKLPRAERGNTPLRKGIVSLQSYNLHLELEKNKVLLEPPP